MFLFVDQILRLEPGKSALGVHHVTANDPFTRVGVDGGRVMLSCVVGEALGQLGAWSVMAANDFSLRPVAGIVGGVHIHDDARAGDTLLLDTTIDSVSDQAVQYHAVATVDGKQILTLESAVGPFLPMADFSDPAVVRKQFATIHRPGAIDGSRWADNAAPADGAPDELPDAFDFDDIDTRADGTEIVATKRVTDRQRFFVDHFQRKPVVPLSLLLEALLQQAGRLLAQNGSAPLRPHRLRSIKMRRFLEPGSTLTAKIRVRERAADAAQVQFRCDIDGQRACTAVAEFHAVQAEETA